MSMSAKAPVRADHRVIHKILDITSADVVYIPKEFSRVSDVFVRYGGSWERLFLGSMADMAMLKKVVKVGVKHGYLTGKGKW